METSAQQVERRAAPKRKPSDDTAGVLVLCALFLLGRGFLSWQQVDPDLAWSFFVRGGLLLPAAVLIWRRWQYAVLATVAGDVLDGLRVIVHSIDGGVLPSFLGIWVRVVLLWLLSLCWRDLRERAAAK